MKLLKLFSLLALMISGILVEAQPNAIHVPNLPTQTPPNLRSGSAERLIGQTDYTYSNSVYTAIDTSFWYYSGSRYLIPRSIIDATNTWLEYASDSSAYMTYSAADSAYENYSKIAQTFDAHNNLLTSIYQWWTGSNYQNSNQFVFTYDNNNNLLTYTIQNYPVNSWQTSSVNTYTYNSNNQMLTNLLQGSSLQDSTNWIYTYDGNGNLASSTNQTWLNNSWLNMVNRTYTYTSANLVAEELDQNWNVNTSAWDTAGLTKYTYDANNNQIEELQLSWDPINPVWDSSFVTRATYNSANKETSYSTQEYQTSGHYWLNENAAYYQYDANNNDTLLLAKKWDSTDSVWINYGENLYSYDANNNQIQDIQGWFTGTDSTWVPYYRYRNAYDALNSMTLLATDQWSGSSWVPATFSSDPGGTMYQVLFYYQPYTPASGLATVAPDEGSLSLYPVPAAQMLHIDLCSPAAQNSSMDIYDVSGRILRQWQTGMGSSYQATIPVSELPEGTYYITATGQNGKLLKTFNVVR